MDPYNTSTSIIEKLRGHVERPPFERYYLHAFLAFLALLTADLLIVGNRDLMMPTSAPPANTTRRALKPLEHPILDKILARNIFNADGVIPPPIGGTSEGPSQENVPVPSQLPLTLIGTIVHVNPAKSVATIELKNANKILPFIPNDDMEGLGTMVKIERKKAIFRNANNHRLEYIEIKEENSVSFETSKKTTASGAEIKQEGNNFTLKRGDLDKLLNNLPEYLQQARAVPHAPNGKIEGFIILDIMPGSIFEKLGVQKNDVIKGVNGRPVDSPAKALELYNELKGASNIALDLERGGQTTTLNYNVQ